MIHSRRRCPFALGNAGVAFQVAARLPETYFSSTLCGDLQKSPFGACKSPRFIGVLQMSVNSIQGQPAMTAEETNAQIAKLMAETAKLNEDILRSIEERMKVVAETKKINKETFWYPLGLVIGIFTGATAFVMALIALVKAFL
ncbi:MAG: hypothetical protein IKX14_05590 [Neisseriaceae bacterium]|nr:hypothetical protein [Neisseriaceae bacterium]